MPGTRPPGRGREPVSGRTDFEERQGARGRPLVDVRAAYLAQQAELDAAVAGVVGSGGFILGPEVSGFEAEFAAFCGTRRAVGVASGTAAIHLALAALGAGPGDELATVAHTFTASAEALLHAG